MHKVSASQRECKFDLKLPLKRVILTLSGPLCGKHVSRHSLRSIVLRNIYRYVALCIYLSKASREVK